MGKTEVRIRFHFFLSHDTQHKQSNLPWARKYQKASKFLIIDKDQQVNVNLLGSATFR